MTEPLTLAAAASRAGVGAAALALGRNLDTWCLALLILALLGLSCLSLPLMSSMFLLLSLAAGVVQKLFSLRVAFDETLFRQWATAWGEGTKQGKAESTLSMDLEELDRTLLACKLAAKQTGTLRDLDSRVRGALGLLKKQLLALVVQCASVVSAALLHAYIQ